MRFMKNAKCANSILCGREIDMINSDKIQSCAYCVYADMEEKGGEMVFICDKGNECKPGYQNGCDDYEPMC
jgi:hypothetical protein